METRSEKWRPSAVVSVGNHCERIRHTGKFEPQSWNGTARTVLPLGTCGPRRSSLALYLQFMLTTLDAKAQTAKSGPSSRGTGRTDAFAFIPSRQVIALLDKTHKLLFNKFFVTPKHLVAVTSTFQPQEQPLSVLDMRVAWALVQAQEGVAFYNGGFSSGASQPRRHLQYIAYADLAQSMGESVRSTLHSSGASVPLDAAVASYRSSRAWCGPAAGESFQLPALPFEHQMWLHGGDLNRTDASSAASALHGRYSSALEAYTRVHGGQSGGPWDGSHNLLLTPSYMLLVPRGKEHALTGQRVSINALGYLGMVLCRPEESVDLRSMGLMQALRACALQAKA